MRSIPASVRKRNFERRFEYLDERGNEDERQRHEDEQRWRRGTYCDPDTFSDLARGREVHPGQECSEGWPRVLKIWKEERKTRQIDL